MPGSVCHPAVANQTDKLEEDRVTCSHSFSQRIGNAGGLGRNQSGVAVADTRYGPIKNMTNFDSNSADPFMPKVWCAQRRLPVFEPGEHHPLISGSPIVGSGPQPFHEVLVIWYSAIAPRSKLLVRRFTETSSNFLRCSQHRIEIEDLKRTPKLAPQR
jgi:hypothetical protein